jgi:hypothetical protein
MIRCGSPLRRVINYSDKIGSNSMDEGPSSRVYAPETKSLSEVAGWSGCAGVKFRCWEVLCVERRGLGDEVRGARMGGSATRFRSRVSAGERRRGVSGSALGRWRRCCRSRCRPGATTGAECPVLWYLAVSSMGSVSCRQASAVRAESQMVATKACGQQISATATRRVAAATVGSRHAGSARRVTSVF